VALARRLAEALRVVPEAARAAAAGETATALAEDDDASAKVWSSRKMRTAPGGLGTPRGGLVSKPELTS